MVMASHHKNLESNSKYRNEQHFVVQSDILRSEVTSWKLVHLSLMIMMNKDSKQKTQYLPAQGIGLPSGKWLYVDCWEWQSLQPFHLFPYL